MRGGKQKKKEQCEKKGENSRKNNSFSNIGVGLSWRYGEKSDFHQGGKYSMVFSNPGNSK
jgi:hypothetical protein